MFCTKSLQNICAVEKEDIQVIGIRDGKTNEHSHVNSHEIADKSAVTQYFNPNQQPLGTPKYPSSSGQQPFSSPLEASH